MSIGLVTCGLHEPFPITSTRCILVSVSLQKFCLKTFDFESGAGYAKPNRNRRMSLRTNEGFGSCTEGFQLQHCRRH
jgi:hypothetical protein